LPVVEQLTAAFSDQGGGLGHTVAMAAQTLKSIFMPIWNGLVSAFNSVKKAIGGNIETFKTFGSLIATYIAPVIGTVLGGALNVAGKIAGGVINVIAGVVKVLNGLIQGAIAGINGLISAYNAIPFLPNVSKISAPKVTVPAIQTPSGSISVPRIPSIPTLTTSGATASGGGGGGGGVSTAATGAATAAARITGLGASGVSGVSTTSLAGIMAASGTTIINVSGAIDKEGTARTIVDTLNNSYYRGTGGASNLIAV
jgi:hypothetical protein